MEAPQSNGEGEGGGEEGCVRGSRKGGRGSVGSLGLPCRVFLGHPLKSEAGRREGRSSPEACKPRSWGWDQALIRSPASGACKSRRSPVLCPACLGFQSGVARQVSEICFQNFTRLLVCLWVLAQLWEDFITMKVSWIFSLRRRVFRAYLKIIEHGLLPLMVVLLAGQTGCFSGNTYTSPRVLEKHQVSFSSAIQAGFTRANQENDGKFSDNVPRLKTTIKGGSLLPSFYQFRLPTSQKTELGLRVSGTSAAPGGLIDLKIEMARGSLDLALDPGLGVTSKWQPALSDDLSWRDYHMELPLLGGLPLGAHEIVLTLAPGYTVRTVDSYFSRPSRVRQSSWWKFASGVRLELSDNLAIFPEISAMYLPAIDNEFTMTAGLGFELRGKAP